MTGCLRMGSWAHKSYAIYGTVYSMEWSLGAEFWSGILEWSGVEWSHFLEWQK